MLPSSVSEKYMQIISTKPYTIHVNKAYIFIQMFINRACQEIDSHSHGHCLLVSSEETWTCPLLFYHIILNKQKKPTLFNFEKD